MSRGLAGPGLFSIAFGRSNDPAKPVLIEVRLTDRDGDGYAVDLNPNDLARLLSGSVLNVEIDAVGSGEVR